MSFEFFAWCHEELTSICLGHVLIIQRNSPINFVKNYDFAYPQLRAHVTFTCVAGHLMHAEFDSAHRPWASCDPFQLFDAPIERFIEKGARYFTSIFLY